MRVARVHFQVSVNLDSMACADVAIYQRGHSESNRDLSTPVWSVV